MADRTEVFEGADGQWYWHRIAPNNQIIAIGGEGFTREDHASRAANRVFPNTAEVVATPAVVTQGTRDGVPIWWVPLAALAGLLFGLLLGWGWGHHVNDDPIAQPVTTVVETTTTTEAHASTTTTVVVPPQASAPTAPAAPTSPAAPNPAEESAAVENGDSLWAIAKRAYGDGREWPRVYEANRDQIADPNLIWSGQVLRIP